MRLRPFPCLLAVVGTTACAAPPTAPRKPDAPVFPGAASIAIRTRDIMIFQDSSFHMIAEAFDSRGAPLARPIRWSSANRQIVAIDTLGFIVGRRAGAVVIRASVDGVADSTVVLIAGDSGALPAARAPSRVQ